MLLPTNSKKIWLSKFLLCIALVISSCTKEEHSIRCRNNFHHTVSSLTIGSVVFGEVLPDKITAYRSIETGDFEISGNFYNGSQLVGAGSVSGKGKHHWTITLNSNGGFSTREDK